jgi:CHAT domain-containing protein/tetratricopeptide (TPR) repeat protein
MSRLISWVSGTGLILLVGGAIGPGAIAVPMAQVKQVQTSELEKSVGTLPSIAAQQQTDEIDRALNEGMRLFREGSKESLVAAISQFEIALQLSRAKGDRSGQALSLLGLGRICVASGDQLKALKYYNQALTLYRLIGYAPEERLRQRNGEARTLNNIGSVYDNLGDKPQALNYYNQALPLLRVAGNRIDEARTLNNIGSVYDDLGDKPQALNYYNQALALFRLMDDFPGEKQRTSDSEASLFNNIGLVYDNLGDKQQALKYYNQALSLFRAVSNRNGEATTLNNIGRVYDNLGDKPKALKYYKQALLLYRTVGNRSGEATTVNNIGLVYDGLGDKPQALKYYNQALSLFRAVGNRDGEARTLNNIGYFLNTQKQPELAIAFFKKSVNVRETLRDNLKSLSRNEQALYTQTIAYTYRTLADILTQQGRLSEAQQVIELLKIRELKELETNRTQSTTAIQQLSIDESEKQNIAKINPEVAKAIQSQSLPTPDRLSPSNPLNRSAQALLTAQPNAALIYQLFTKDKLWLILITPDGKLQRFASTSNQAKIESIVTNFRTQIERCEKQNYTCDQTDTQNLNKISQELHQQLFPPDLQAALKQAQSNHLIFALDGSLRNIPMAALHDGKAYLAQQYTLSSIIAAQLTDTQDKIPANTRQSPVLAVGVSQAAAITVPDYINQRGQDRYDALKNVPDELNAIVPPNNSTTKSPSSFPGKQLLDSDFNLANLQKYLPQYGILHIASHGIFRPNSLDYSYILMGNNQRWSIAQMDKPDGPSPDGIAQDKTKTKLFQNIHMVSISTCQSGLGGRDTNGIEIAGMSHAFLSQGAKTVTASLWQVNDGSTRVLMNHFYQNLVQNPNQSKAQSLRDAQLYLLQTPETTIAPERRFSVTQHSQTIVKPLPSKTPDYKHPYYWASFTLIGNSL